MRAATARAKSRRSPSVSQTQKTVTRRELPTIAKNYSFRPTAMWAYRLSVDEYQQLIDRGWRRSGKYCYKPSMQTTCCPSYAIRCPAKAFRISKSQKKVIKRVNRYLANGVEPAADADATGHNGSGEGDGDGDVCGADSMGAHLASVGREDRMELAADSTEMPHVEVVAPKTAIVAKPSPSTVDTIVTDAELESTPMAASPIDVEYPKQKKAKQMRLERRLAKQLQKPAGELNSAMDAQPKNAEKTLQQWLADGTSNVGGLSAHKLELRVVESAKSLAETPQLFPLYQKYQTRVHGDKIEKLTLKSFDRFLVQSPFAVKTCILLSTIYCIAL